MIIIGVCVGLLTGAAMYAWGYQDGLKKQEKKVKDMEEYIKHLETKCFDHAFDW